MSGGRNSSDAEGYVEDIPYTYGYQPDLDPAVMRRVLQQAGLAAPRVERACELGYGQGLSLAIHAVAGGARWWGTDLNPAHVATLQGLVAGTGAALEACGEAFAGFCSRGDLPDFDLVGAHGVWSWVSAENRARIVEFLQRRLRPGGVFYLSYNALPGWAPMLPLRAMMMRTAQAAAPELPLAERIEAALRDATMRLARDPSFEDAHPGIEAELRALRGKRTAYLAHELFNRDWAPMHPDEVAAMLQAAGLRLAAQAGGDGESTRFRREYWLMGGARRDDVAADVAADAAPDARRAAACRLLNRRLLALALESPDPSFLASPVTGGGVEVGYTAMLLLEAWQRGLRDPAALAEDVGRTLSRLGQRLLHEGEVVTDPRRTRALLAADARGLPEDLLPRLAALHALPFEA